MTTPAAAALYLAQHQFEFEGRPLAVFNPQHKPVGELPVIYGFNNGGSPGFLEAVLISEAGVELGQHLCSHEGYMPADLGCIQGARPDRHEGFQQEYPDGYRMEFITYDEVEDHPGLRKAFELFEERNQKGETP